MLELTPTILDASVFTSQWHLERIIDSQMKSHVSATLYDLLYVEYQIDRVADTLRKFVWRPRSYLPSAKLELKHLLIPYEANPQYVENLYPYYERSRLPPEVKQIILDEYSFLREKSSVLMVTKRFPRHLHQWGVTFLDATNRFYDRKHTLFEKIRGPKWILGLTISLQGIAEFPKDPTVGGIMTLSGIVFAAVDP